MCVSGRSHVSGPPSGPREATCPGRPADLVATSLRVIHSVPAASTLLLELTTHTSASALRTGWPSSRPIFLPGPPRGSLTSFRSCSNFSPYAKEHPLPSATLAALFPPPDLSPPDVARTLSSVSPHRCMRPPQSRDSACVLLPVSLGPAT